MFNKHKKKMRLMKKNKKNPSAMVSITKPNSRVAEQFRTIRTNIQFSMADHQFQTILFSSSSPFEGKSLVCANTASVFADQGKRVLIVDADMRKPSMAKTFHLKNDVGLSTLLASKKVEMTDAIQHVASANLDILPSGLIPPNPTELLGSNRMGEIIQTLKQMYDLILFDLPPIVSVTDAQILAAKVDGVIFVIRKDVANVEDIYKAKELLEHVNANILGAVFNGEARQKEYSNGYYI
jgi:capsular exopolysaccharide synthesis family protein